MLEVYCVDIKIPMFVSWPMFESDSLRAVNPTSVTLTKHRDSCKVVGLSAGPVSRSMRCRAAGSRGASSIYKATV
jgi:hypothetical protein